MSMNPPSVLIVGAGAVGLVVGYHLSLGGTDVTFYVRPGRVAALQAPQKLYCYDDASLKAYASYSVASSPKEVAAQAFDFVFVTLDGAMCFSAEGSALLRDLADAIRPTTAKLIIGAVGVGLREHYLKVTGLPEDRLMEGMFAILSHQVARAHLPVLPPTDPAQLAQADLAYRHFSNGVGFNIVSAPAEAARRFAALYNRSGVSRCIVVSRALHEIITNSFFPLTACCELAGWPNAAGMAQQKELWSLCCRAQREIMALPQHGWLGKLLSLLLRDGLAMMLLRKLERDCLPLDFHAFNRFHHGGKVRAQDAQVMANCVRSGEAQGRPMTALKDILRRMDAQAQHKH